MRFGFFNIQPCVYIHVVPWCSLASFETVPQWNERTGASNKKVFHPSLSSSSQRTNDIVSKNPNFTEEVFILLHLFLVEWSKREKDSTDSRHLRFRLSRTFTHTCQIIIHSSHSLPVYLPNKSHLSRVTLMRMHLHSALHRDGIISMSLLWKQKTSSANFFFFPKPPITPSHRQPPTSL